MRDVPTKPDDAVMPHEAVISWSEDYKLFKSQQHVTFSGDSYDTWLSQFFWVFDLPRSKQSTADWVAANAKPVGEYYLYMREFPMWTLQASFPFAAAKWIREKLPMYDSRQIASYCHFDRVVHIPVMLSLRCDVEVWMSLTPNEVLTQRAQIRRARGRVGVAGLGMGWAVQRMLERRQVQHLTVVEKDAAILEYFGTPLKQTFGARLNLVHGDAYEQDWLEYDTVLWDIWPGMLDGYHDTAFQELRAACRRAGIVCEGWASWVPRS